MNLNLDLSMEVNVNMLDQSDCVVSSYQMSVLPTPFVNLNTCDVFHQTEL